MKEVVAFVVFFASVFKLMATYPQTGFVLEMGNMDRRSSCKDGLEYPHGSICCLNCLAGTHLKLPCTTAGEKGTCEECDFGTYTEYSNHLQQCLTCKKCHPDQEVVRQCTHSQNTECQCKSGKFCDPDDACEVCKTCASCKSDEVTVRNCTSTSNAECKKKHSTSESGYTEVTVPVLVILAVVFTILVVYMKKCRTTDSQRSLCDGIKIGQVVGSLTCTEDAHRMLCGSLNSSASNSQHSLTVLQSSSLLFHQQQPTSMPSMEPRRREHEPFPILVPVNGEDSLRRCFEFFEKLDVDQHKRFFRHLALTDNVIKSKESLPYEDRIHELLNVWVEKEGQRASLNDLLEMLLDLNQRRTAEDIKNAAIAHGYYRCDC